MNALDLHFVAQLSVERLANCLAQGTVIALFAWLLLRMIGRRNSGTRFAVWFCALLAIAAVPFVEFSSGGSATAHVSNAAIVFCIGEHDIDRFHRTIPEKPLLLWLIFTVGTFRPELRLVVGTSHEQHHAVFLQSPVNIVSLRWQGKLTCSAYFHILPL